MAKVPADRTKLNLAVSDQSQSTTPASGQKNREALTEAYDTIDLLNQKVDGLVPGPLAASPPAYLGRQTIVNSNMEVAAKGTSFTVATATSAVTLDHYKSANLGTGVNATVTQVDVADLDFATKGMQMVHAGAPTAQGKLSHTYTVEAKDSYKLAGRQMTIAVKVKAVAGMDRVTINARYNTTGADIANTDTLIAASVTTAVTSGGWTTVTLTVTMPLRATLTATGVIGIEIIASKTTTEANGDGFIIAQLQMNQGDAALPFQPKSYAEELSSSGSATLTSGFKVYQTPAQASIAASTLTKVLFQTEVYDHFNEYDTATSKFTAQKAGVYLVNSMVGGAVVFAVDSLVAVFLYKNGTQYKTLQSDQSGGASGAWGGSAQVKLIAGDFLEIYVIFPASSSTSARELDTFLEVTKIA